MKQTKLKTLALSLGTAMVLGTGVNAYAADEDIHSTVPPLNSGSKGSDATNRKPVPESSGSIGQYVDDATVTARVKARFAKDDVVSALQVEVETTKGIVVLTGNVDSKAERDRAIKIAREVPDVRSVRDRMTIQNKASRSDDMDHMGGPSPDRAKNDSGSVGQYVDDATITTRVKTRFAKDDVVSALGVDVETTKGIVVLSGNVNSEKERSRAVSIARDVPDVRGVRDKMMVKAKAAQ